MLCLERYLQDEQASVQFAEQLAIAVEQLIILNKGGVELIVYLEGDLGAGKSFFSRAFVQHFLPEQKVKSPTYNLVESYQTELMQVHHFDLYRLSDPEELEYLALRDLFIAPFIALIEWAEKGESLLPPADIVIHFQHPESIADNGRKAYVTASSVLGEKIIRKI